jgi:hypothetical protein
VSIRGWAVLRRFDEGERELTRRYWARYARRLTAEERIRIADDRLGPLTRPVEPAFEPGDELVVQRTPARTYLDQELGTPFTVPAEDALVIVITKIVRARRGGWTIHFDVKIDRREQKLYIRRRPPAYDAETMARDRIDPPTPKDIEFAHLDGAYTSDVRQAADTAEAVPPEGDNLYRMKARLQRAEKERSMSAERLQAEAERKVSQALKQGAKRIADAGGDPVIFLARMEKAIEDQVREGTKPRAA